MLEFIDRCGIGYSSATSSILEKCFILEDCIDAITNESADSRIISTATSYTYSIVYEFLEHVKEMLTKLAQAVLSALNNFYLNNAKIMDKYHDIIAENIRKLDKPIRQETYEYPKCKDYPVNLKSTISVENDIIRLHESIKTRSMAPEEVAANVDLMLIEFGKEVIDSPPDPYDLKDSTAKIVRDTVQGKETTVIITPATFDKYLHEIMNYKQDRDDIMQTKKAINDDYTALKRTYSKVTKDPKALMSPTIQNFKDPDRAAFIAREYSRYSNIHVEMMRLFNGFINIYNVAFDTKLKCLNEKIERNKAIIIEIITRTGLFTSLNPKVKEDKPIPRDIATKK